MSQQRDKSGHLQCTCSEEEEAYIRALGHKKGFKDTSEFIHALIRLGLQVSEDNDLMAQIIINSNIGFKQ